MDTQQRRPGHFRIKPFWIGWLFALCALLAVSPPAKAEKITFPDENVSDMRGILNVFHMFREACLKEPVSPDLPARIAPADYQITPSMVHMGMVSAEDAPSPASIVILSRTGDEEADLKEGHPYARLSMPDADDPFGECAVYWEKAWDYEEGRDRIAQSHFVIFDSWVSFKLQSVLLSRPPRGFDPDGPYSTVSEWMTSCWDGRVCSYSVHFEARPKSGLMLTLTVKDVLR